MNDGMLVLSWNEGIDSSVVFTGLTLLSASANGSNFTLTNGSVTQTSSDVITVQISDDDLNSIKVNPVLAISMASTYLTIDADSINDNRLNPNTPQGPIQAADFDSDLTRPMLLSYDFNLDSLTVTLRFSETVNSSLLQPSEITFPKCNVLSNVYTYPNRRKCCTQRYPCGCIHIE